MLHAKRYGSWAGTLLLALALVVSLAACDSDDDPVSDNGDDDNGDEPALIADLLEENPDLETLFTAVEESGQLDLTADPDADITVFAPNNGAFADIELSAALAPENEALLADIVQYHVVPGGLLSSEIDEGTLTSALGDDLQVESRNGDLFINEAQVVDPDNEAANGVLHVVDELLLENRSLLERVSLTASTQALVGSAGDTGLVDAFENAENWTLFAPINEAFEAADTGDLSDEELAEAVQYHVALGEDGPISAADLVDRIDANGGEATVPTAQGESITFTQEGDDIILNGGQAIIVGGGTDRFTDNYTNVFHLIDGVLIPPSLQPEEAMPIADAREEADDAEVVIEGILTRGLGRYLFIQDESAGIMLFEFDGFNDEIDAGDLAVGDEVRVEGFMDTFNDQRQLRIDGDEFSIVSLSSGNDLPDLQTITLEELAENGADYEHQLVRVEGFTIDPDGDDVFQAGGPVGNYTIDDGTSEGTLRLEGNDSSFYEGESIPDGEVTFEGAVSQFQGSYQLHLALESDLIIE